MTSAENRKWRRGQSSNPAGRLPAMGKVAALRKQIENHVPEIIAALVTKASDGDAGAATLQDTDHE